MAEPFNPKDAISCTDSVNGIFWCLTPRNQFRSYYRYGKADKCTRQINDVMQCVKIKAARPDDAKQMLMDLVKKTKSTTLGSIWEARSPDDPGF